MAFPYYKQYDSMDCGPTCLRMIAKYYGKIYSLQELREKTLIGKDGVNLLGISEAAVAIGFKAEAIKLDLLTLMTKATLPVILHWDQNHFVVLYKIRKNKFYVADPARGLVSYSIQEFTANWLSFIRDNSKEGIALFLSSTESVDIEKKGLENSASPHLQNFLKYILPYKKAVIKVFICLGLATGIQTILPFLTRSIVDKGINSANLHFVTIILLAQFALLSGRIAIEFVRNWILTHVSLSINISILSKFLSKLMKLPISFFDSKRTGDILQRMNDHSRIESFLTGSSLNTLFSLINLFIFSIVLIFFNTRIFFIFFIASFLYSLWVVFFLKKRKELDHKRFGLASQEQSKAIQFIQGMEEIKLHGMEKKIKKTWENLQQGLYKIGIKGLVLTQKQQAGSFIINESKNLIITFLSAKAVIEGQMTLGSMIAIQYIVGQLNSPIEQMTGFLQSLQNATISMDRLNEIHNLQDEEPEHIQFKQIPPGLTSKLAGGLASVDIEEPFLNVNKEFQFTTDSISLKKIEPGIHLQNLSFSYKGAGNEPVLKDVNLFIPKGKTTAIVGVSGSGKTTLLKLLLKFYEPTNGNIKLNEISLNEISAGQWRKSCGAVMQDSFIFSDSIANNIALGAEELDIAKLNSALEISNLSEFIEGLPLGINTKIGAEGTGISMGQKQRVLIARVVYKNPDFVFFDEATNSLDANNESSIIKKIESFLKHKTFVVVAHRLSTVKNADQIIVLDKGRIVEKGKHVQLINQQGFYYTLVRNQLEIGE